MLHKDIVLNLDISIIALDQMRYFTHIFISRRTGNYYKPDLALININISAYFIKHTISFNSSLTSLSAFKNFFYLRSVKNISRVSTSISFIIAKFAGSIRSTSSSIELIKFKKLKNAPLIK